MANESSSRANESHTLTEAVEAKVGRLRHASVSVVSGASKLLLENDPQPGMWAATGAAIAHAPNLTDLRNTISGGENIEFDAHGHSARDASSHVLEQEHLERTKTLRESSSKRNDPDIEGISTAEIHKKAPWSTTIVNGLSAFWKFFITPTGFLIVIYGLNVVAWGAMLFFLLLKAAPAMDHPDDGDADSSPRKIWIEIDSQILCALFCLTSWGLAPWRFRDLWWLTCCRLHLGPDKGAAAYRRLAARNVSWFRLPEDGYEEGGNPSDFDDQKTFTGKLAPPTAWWKIDFVVWMMVWNTLLQVGMAYMMWHYNRIERPTWGAGLFIGLGCAVSLFAGLMTWWEGRKIKRTEGPKILSSAESGQPVDQQMTVA